MKEEAQTTCPVEKIRCIQAIEISNVNMPDHQSVRTIWSLLLPSRCAPSAMLHACYMQYKLPKYLKWKGLLNLITSIAVLSFNLCAIRTLRRTLAAKFLTITSVFNIVMIFRSFGTQSRNSDRTISPEAIQTGPKTWHNVRIVKVIQKNKWKRPYETKMYTKELSPQRRHPKKSTIYEASIHRVPGT